MFNAKGGRGRGLFGNVTASTAKLINPNEIGVKFKFVIDIFPSSIVFFDFVLAKKKILRFVLGMLPDAKRLKLRLWNLSISLKTHNSILLLEQRFLRVQS